MIGMFAAAQGLPRGADLSPYDSLEFTVRADRPGTALTDFHTAGGGEPKEFSAATSGGKHKGTAVITRRHYLADAVFVVAVTGPHPILDRLADALRRPHWSPYLGRRSCPPDEPFLLRDHVQDPVAELTERVPLSPPAGLEPWHNPPEAIPVDFYWERYPGGPVPDDAVPVEIYDAPISFAPHARNHGKRLLYRTTRNLPKALLAPRDALHESLVDYALGTQEVPV
jgi:CRISPR system Cascade subunit CasD